MGAAASSWVLVGWLRRWTLSRGVLDVPNERSSHVEPTPRGGGLAFAVVALVALLVIAAAEGGLSRGAWTYLFGAFAVAAVSFTEDVRGVPAVVRFGVHSLAAALVVWGWGNWDMVRLPWIGDVELGIAGAALAWLWVVSFTNFYNFMDGIDGIAGGQALVAAVCWAIACVVLSADVALVVSIALGGAAVGFLVHNWHPARIFMGDVGSAFLGFTFAVFPVLIGGVHPALPALAVAFVFPFVLDAMVTVIRRGLRGDNVLRAHRTHLYQRLVQSGHSHSRVALAYAMAAAVTGATGLYWLMDRL